MNIKKNICIALLLGAYGFSASAQQKEYSWTNLPKIAQPVFKKDTVNILKYGAKPDGMTLNTKSINAAISACSAKGGGVVLIPQGLWLTGPIVLKSNVNLHVSRAALLQFTNDKSQYPLVEGNYEGHPSPRNQSPISGTNLVNIGITGDGIIDGAGGVWRAIGKERLSEAEWKMLVASGGKVSENGKTWYPSDSYLKGMNEKEAIYLKPGKSLKDYEDMKDFFRPNMVVLTNCKKVLLQNVTVQNSPAWCLHPLLCEDLTLRNVRVRNPWNAQNGDAIDIESCRNVLLEGNTFDAGDDGICIKSGRDEEGRKRGKPTENVIARNNVVYRAHGGFVIGSEMSGGARNIFVTDCTFIGTDIGLRFKTTRGRGGVVEKIYVKNISMKDIIGSAILFDMYYGGKSVLDGEGNKVANTKTYTADITTPQFKDFYVSNVVCDGAASGLLIRGLPELAIKGIHLENIVLKTTKGADISEASNVTLKNVYLECTDTKPVVTIENSSDIKLDGLKYTNNADVLFSVTGDRSKNISVINTDTSKAKEKVTFKAGADSKAITIK
ncbi:glycoside hydrolase family 28 protein [Mucilaginibacter boryungensis]|uniref:Glycoside hydrolase family 28 protein n=1 Tax=Mucilaginibacter boryungensis TaxID=768480 RepID=A0ABR9XGW2_9SPHI|nr:glycoside hydrolase family 28 protein [Mucilaginibacter boryungensis]MBE9666627.1 glycoside hydrolase family 28 protein [Mucilaginibacter boryungensis]